MTVHYVTEEHCYRKNADVVIMLCAWNVDVIQ